MSEPKCLVEFWSREAEYYRIAEYKLLPLKSCTLKYLARLAAERNALFVLCPQKYGRKQIKPLNLSHHA